MYQCTRTESHDWASGQMWNVSQEVKTVFRHSTKLFMDRSTKGFEIIKMLFDNFSNPHTPFEMKAPATQRHSLLLRSHVTETHAFLLKPSALQCAIRPICTITMSPRWQHQFSPPEKRKPSPGTNNQTPISLNFQRGKLSVDWKNYTIVTQNMAVIT